jgi:osmotically-inducible protein OsmY
VTTKISALRLGSRVKFEDRWRGVITALETTEDWEVVNVVVEGGFLIWRTSIRLPLSSATEWDDDHVAFACTSGAAFRHEIPPVAVPSRPVGKGTPLSLGGASFAGAIVRATDRQIAELIVSRGVAGMNRVPIKEASFERKVLAISALPETLSRYRADNVIEAEVHKTIREDTGITGDDKRGLKASVVGGVVTISGNARVHNAIERATGLISRIPGVVMIRIEAIDDLSLETAIGLALDKAGLSRHSDVYARASIGVVTLFGSASSATAADDVVRAVDAVPGVREVVNKLEVAAAA